MVKKRKETTVIFMTIALLIFCGMPIFSQGSQERVSERAPSVVEIEFYFPEGFNRPLAFGKVIEKFEQAHPNIKVRTRITPYTEFITSLAIMWAANDVSDVVLTNSPDIKQYAYEGALLPLDDLFPKSDYQYYAPGIIEDVLWEGSIYGAPIWDSAVGLYYNVDMFNDAGIQAPRTLDEAWTFNEFVTNVTKVMKTAEKNQNRKVWGMASVNNPLREDYWNMWIVRSAGTEDSNTFKSISDDGTKLRGYLDTPEAIEALKFYQKLYNEYEFMPKADVPDGFGTGQVATYLGPISSGWTFTNNFPNLNWDVMPLPYFVTPITHTGSFAPSIAARTRHPEAAKAFVKYLSSAEALITYAQYNQSLPGRIDIRNQIPEFSEGHSLMFQELNEKWGRSRPMSPGHTIYQNIISRDMMLDIAYGADVERTVRDAINAAESQLRRYAR